MLERVDAKPQDPASTPTSIRQQGPRELAIDWADLRVRIRA
jgi:hypothetical protein